MAQSKKFFTKEVKIGIAFVVALALLIYGANFLKGIDLFSPTNTYYLKYSNLDQLVVSNGVFIKGYKVGQVKDIKYDFTRDESFTVEIIVNKDIRLPRGTVAYLFDESLLGGKGINLVFGEADGQWQNPGDTLATDTQTGLIGMLSEVVPSLQSTIGHADTLIVSANNLINSPDIAGALADFKQITGNLRHTSDRLNYMIDVRFPPIVNNIDSVVGDVRGVTSQLREADIRRITTGLDTTIQNLRQLTERINSNQGTVGRLLNDKSLYESVDNTINSANDLLIDLRQNPGRYVHFSLFGGKKEKKEQKK